MYLTEHATSLIPDIKTPCCYGLVTREPPPSAPSGAQRWTGHMPQPWGDLQAMAQPDTEIKNPQKNVHTVSSSEFTKAPASSEADMALPGHSKITSGKYPWGSERKLSRQRGWKQKMESWRRTTRVEGRIWKNQSGQEPFPKSTRHSASLSTKRKVTPGRWSGRAWEAAQWHVSQKAGASQT